MGFYTHIHSRGNKIFLRGYENGQKISEVVEYRPYLFTPKEGGEFKTLDGRSVAKRTFENIRKARDYVEMYKDVQGKEIFGLTDYKYVYLFDRYQGEIQYDPSLIRVCTLDIECAADEGFPDVRKAEKEITAITFRLNGRSAVFGCGDFKTSDPNIFYTKCKDEYELIRAFLDVWQSPGWAPDILTGWNIEFFDIPYLVNRIKFLFSEKEANRLSPWGMVEEKNVETMGRESQTYTLVGIASLDYYHLYRKFSFGNEESYKLDYIAQIELGEKKIDFSEYGNLLLLYKNNFQKFIEYNIHDCVLVDKLEGKLKFLEQVMALAYDAKVNYNDTLTTVRPWDVIIHNHLLEQKIVVPHFKYPDHNVGIEGGHVKEPKIGLSKWIVSFDLNSLYPHLIMQYNISPETYVGRLEDFPSIEAMLAGRWPAAVGSVVTDDKFSYAANGCVFRKDKMGFLPTLMLKIYNDRTLYKEKMIEAKKKFERTKDPADEQLIARYHNMQMAKKIQLNSAYGALANLYFRWYNFRHAEAITMSGRLSIRFIEKKINQLLNKLFKTTDVDYVIASDTDSLYITLETLIESEQVKQLELTELQIVEAIDQFCKLKIQPFLNKSFEELAANMHAFDQKMQMKRETIANKGIWRGKKMYILNAWNVEGVQYDKPKLKLSGIEAVRSSTPYACRENIKKALEVIMNGTESDLQKFVGEFREKFDRLPFEDVAFPRGVNGVKKYANKSTIYAKGTPIQVRGALIFNSLIQKKGLGNIAPISDGDKIRFAYLKMPNPIQDNVISVPDKLPDEFGLEQYIDRTIQFEKSFLQPVRSITSVIGWDVEHRSTLEEFF